MKNVLYGQAADTIIIVVACYTIGRDKKLSYTITRLQQPRSAARMAHHRRPGRGPGLFQNF